MGALAEFWKFVKDARGVFKWIAITAVSTPVVDLIVRVGAPWPDRWVVAFITTLVELIGYVFCFQVVMQWKKERLEVWLTRSLVLCLILVCGYMALFSLYIVPAPNHWHRVVIGYKMTDQAQQHQANNPGISNTTLLEHFENNVEEVWTLGSLTVTRLVVLSTWIGLFLLVTLSFTIFLILQRTSPGAAAK
jgi:hypothetical protein